MFKDITGVEYKSQDALCSALASFTNEKVIDEINIKINSILTDVIDKNNTVFTLFQISSRKIEVFIGEHNDKGHKEIDVFNLSINCDTNGKFIDLTVDKSNWSKLGTRKYGNISIETMLALSVTLIDAMDYESALVFVDIVALCEKLLTDSFINKDSVKYMINLDILITGYTLVIKRNNRRFMKFTCHVN